MANNSMRVASQHCMLASLVQTGVSLSLPMIQAGLGRELIELDLTPNGNMPGSLSE